jgi:hypothetical protein
MDIEIQEVGSIIVEVIASVILLHRMTDVFYISGISCFKTRW